MTVRWGPGDGGSFGLTSTDTTMDRASERELADILDPWEDPTTQGPHLLPEAVEDFPGETFRVLKEKEERAYGEYRTRKLVLEAWERQGETFEKRGNA